MIVTRELTAEGPENLKAVLEKLSGDYQSVATTDSKSSDIFYKQVDPQSPYVMQAVIRIVREVKGNKDKPEELTDPFVKVYYSSLDGRVAPQYIQKTVQEVLSAAKIKYEFCDVFKLRLQSILDANLKGLILLPPPADTIEDVSKALTDIVDRNVFEKFKEHTQRTSFVASTSTPFGFFASSSNAQPAPAVSSSTEPTPEPKGPPIAPGT